MGIEVQASENEAESIIAQSYDEIFSDEAKEEVKEVEEEVTEEVEDSPEEEVEEGITEESSEVEEDESTEEVEDEKEVEEGRSPLKKELYMVFNDKYIDLLESIEDPDLRDKFIEEGRKQRSEIDRKREELGEGKKVFETLEQAVKDNGLSYNKKQYADLVKNFMGFDALFNKDPRHALETLAKQANIDLESFSKQAVPSEDNDDYRLPEEIARDEKLEALERKLNQYENQQQQQSQISVQQEINNFASTKDSEGNLKYPHFDRVRANMGLFFNDSNPDMTMDVAYQKAIRLDDELFNQEKEGLLKKAESKRKVEIEKAKKLKKQSVRSSNIKTANQSPRKALESIVSDLGFG